MPQNTFDDESTLVQVLLDAVRQLAITRAYVDPDLCRHIASLGHNVFFKKSTVSKTYM